MFFTLTEEKTCFAKLCTLSMDRRSRGNACNLDLQHLLIMVNSDPICNINRNSYKIELIISREIFGFTILKAPASIASPQSSKTLRTASGLRTPTITRHPKATCIVKFYRSFIIFSHYQLPDSLLSNTPATSCNYNKLPSLIHKRWQVAVAVPHLKFVIYSELNNWYLREAVKKQKYFTVRLTVRVDPHPLRSVFVKFLRGAFDLGL